MVSTPMAKRVTVAITIMATVTPASVMNNTMIFHWIKGIVSQYKHLLLLNLNLVYGEPWTNV